jgi:hypothetical protein
MKKQISYPDFITRVFCTTLDLLILACLVAVIDPFIRKPSCLFALRDIIANNNLDASNLAAMDAFFQSYQFSGQSDMNALLLCKIITPLTEIVMLIAYMLFFWLKFNQTPAKIILRLKIVDKNTLQSPSKKQFIKRLLVSPFYLIGIWLAIASKQKQTLHDLVAGTIVIKA